MAGDRLRGEIYWEAAETCESHFRTIHLDRIDSEGNVSAHADADSRGELPGFTSCYRAELDKVVAKRRQSGLPVPDDFKVKPGVDLD